MIAYIETSAAAKILFIEPESKRLAAYLDQRVAAEDSLVCSVLLETELRRAAVRENAPQVAVTAILDRFDVFDLHRSTYTEAGILPGAGLRSLEALPIVAALRVGADVMVSYDHRQIEAAEAAGLRTVSP